MKTFNIFPRIFFLLLFGATLWSSCDPQNIDDTVLVPVFDCTEIEANIGDECTTGSGVGIVNENCECEVNTSEYDCPELQLNYEWDCPLGNNEWGYVNDDCECVPYGNGEDFCEELQLYIGNSCSDPANGIEAGVVNENCECESTAITYDCPELEANFGSTCLTDSGENGTVNENCECIEQEWDCPEYQTNIGWDCPLGNGEWGGMTLNCDCVPNSEFCWELYLAIGDPCTDVNGVAGTVSADCGCE